VSDAVVVGDDGRARCPWGLAPPEYATYHDEEWGRPVVDDVRLFEKLCLEGFQAGLSWLTILRKREGFRAAFAGFDPEVVARFDAADVERLLGDAGIVRHRGKIEAAIGNARATLDLRAERGSLAALVWAHEPEPAAHPPRTLGEVPATSPASVALSRTLRARGFRFVGPTTVHAFLQAMGLVNEHLEGCWVREEVERARARVRRPSGAGPG